MGQKTHPIGLELVLRSLGAQSGTLKRISVSS